MLICFMYFHGNNCDFHLVLTQSYLIFEIHSKFEETVHFYLSCFALVNFPPVSCWGYSGTTLFLVSQIRTF